MALIRLDHFSDVLELSTTATVLLPESAERRIGMAGRAPVGDPPVLYLLHGLSDDHSAWLRRTAVERYVAPLGLAVVMPQVHRSYYLDGVHTGDYWTYLTEELPAVVHRLLRVSRRPRDTFVAGLSMGGYGALRWALAHPDRVAAAASMSGALDVPPADVDAARSPRLWRAVLGELGVSDDPRSDGELVRGERRRDRPGELDLLALLDRHDRSDVRRDRVDVPPLWVGCGTDDPLLPASERFVAGARGRGVDVTWRPSPGGHDWAVWDRAIRDVLAWLPLDGAVADG